MLTISEMKQLSWWKHLEHAITTEQYDKAKDHIKNIFTRFYHVEFGDLRAQTRQRDAANTLFDYLQVIYFEDPNKAKAINELMNFLLDFAGVSPRINLPSATNFFFADASNPIPPAPPVSAYKEITGEILTSNEIIPNNKKKALKLLQLNIFSLLNSPSHCKPLLKKIDELLDKQFIAMHGIPFPRISQKATHIFYYDFLSFPIPPDNYMGIKKQCALQSVLISILRSHGIANDIYKWIGFVIPEKANEQVKKGNFVIEEAVGVSVLHGKFTHMIHWVMIILAFESGLISREYEDENHKIQTLSLSDLFESIVENDNWTKILDEYTTERYTFTDPIQLNSYIINNQADYPALSSSITDTYYKQFAKLLKFHNELFLETPCDKEGLAKKLARMPADAIGKSPLAKKFTETISSQWEIIAQESSYGIAKRKAYPSIPERIYSPIDFSIKPVEKEISDAPIPTSRWRNILSYFHMS